jgi:parallel beta-helix repeat protein
MLAGKNLFYVLLCLLAGIASGSALQTSPASAVASTDSGVISAYDANGKLISTIDAAGNRSRPGLGPIDAAPLPRKTQSQAAATGVIIHVPSDQPTIQAAIDAASPGDTVLVADGTYKESIDFHGKALTVTSENGAAVTTIDAGKLNTVVFFVTGETSAAVLNGFTITNGLSGFQSPGFGEGGGIIVANASPTITNNVITNNGACNGAGIGIGFAGPLIQGNTITNNFQAGCSGGIGGGGISIRGESSGTRLLNNVISNNTMTGSGINGGGLVLFAGGAPVIENNIFSNNTQFGIAMVNSSTPQFNQNLITHNTGGGLTLAFGGGAGMTVIGNTFADNDAQTSFVAQFNAGSAISGNFGSDTIIQNNQLIAKPGQVAVFCTSALPSAFANNNVFSDGGSTFNATCGTPTGTQGNISSDPLFVDAAVDNFHLQPQSPAVDTGTNGPPAPPATDLNGDPRIVNTTVDIGAFEFQGSTTATYSATSLTYAKQLVNTTGAPQAITITHTGSRALQLTPFIVTGDFSETDNCHTSNGLPAAQSCTVNVSFTPTTHGTRNGLLTITSNDTGSPVSITLTGFGGSPIVSLSVPGLTFANQLVGTTSSAQSFTLSNTGDDVLNLAGVAATGDFGQTNDCGTSIAVSAFCTVNVTFTPTLRGQRNGSVTIADNAPGSPHSVTLQGTGTGPAITLGATSVAFANQLAGTTSSAQSVSLTSSGETDLNVSSITASGDFAQTNDCGTTIPAGQGCTIQITFTPAARGLRSGTVTISDNSTSSPEHISLSGTGVAPVATLSRTSVDFGIQVLNSSATSTISLTNTGDAALAISSIVTGGNFAQSNDCGTSLAPFSSCNIHLLFSATAVGPRIGTLTLTDSALDSPQIVNLSGTGAELAFSSSSLSFGNQLSGTTSAAQPVTVTNPGTSEVSVTGVIPSAGFSQTNNCGFSLAGNASCTVNVAFAPTAAGAVSGLITLNYNGRQSTIAVSGTGTDFSVAPQQDGGSTATVTAGGTATYNLSLVGTAGAANSVTMTCSGAPLAATCAVSPGSASLNGTTPVNFTVTVSTTSRAALLPPDQTTPLNPGPVKLLWLVWLAFGAALLISSCKYRKLRPRIALAVGGMGIIMLMAACGGGSTPTPPPPPPVPHGTPAGMSTLVVTATSGTATRTFNLTLNVN